MEHFAAEDIAAMREEGDLAAFMRLRIRPAPDTVQVVALWQRFSAPGCHVAGAWPSAVPQPAGHRRTPGTAARCDCSRCRALGTSCEAGSCRCPLRGAHHASGVSRPPWTDQGRAGTIRTSETPASASL